MRGKSGLLTKRYLGRTCSIKGGASPWIVPQKITALYLYKVRVKTGGKSTRQYVAMHAGGKPYREQDKVGTCRPSFRLNVRVCRIDTWLPHSRK